MQGVSIDFPDSVSLATGPSDWLCPPPNWKTTNPCGTARLSGIATEPPMVPPYAGYDVVDRGV